VSLKVAIAADHGGFTLKTELEPWLKESYQVLNFGADTLDPFDDYPDYADRVAQAVAAGQTERGIIICGSGIGGAITANKVPGVRAGLCHDIYSARQGVEHDDMNVLCLGARIIGSQLARELIGAFLQARFLTEEKYRRRLGKVLAIESRALAQKQDEP